MCVGVNVNGPRVVRQVTKGSKNPVAAGALRCSLSQPHHAAHRLDNTGENSAQPAEGARIETLKVYFGLQVVMGLVSEHVFLQLVVLGS